MSRLRPRSFLIALLSLVLLAGAGAPAIAQDATPGVSPAGGDSLEGDSLLAELGYPEIRVTTDGTTHDFPTELEAGRYHVVLENQGDRDVAYLELLIEQLPEGMTFEEAKAAFDETEAAGRPVVPPDIFFEMVYAGGLGTAAGETKGFVLDLTPGEWTVILTAYGPESEEGTDMPVTVTVTGEMPETEEPTGHVEIGLVEMEFVVPDRQAAGPQVWQVTNTGLQPHHIVLSRVPDGTTEEQVIEFVSLRGAPPASPQAAATPGIEPGLAYEDVEGVFFTQPLSREQVNLYELDLEPGTYAMTCYMPDPSGTAHVMLGMVEIVTVE